MKQNKNGIYSCYDSGLKPIIDADYCELGYKRENRLAVIALILLGLFGYYIGITELFYQYFLNRL